MRRLVVLLVIVASCVVVVPRVVQAQPAGPLTLVEQGFGQDGDKLVVAFLVDNSDQVYALADVGYRVAAYDTGGALLGTETGFIDLVLPGERTAMVGLIWLDSAAVTVASLDVQIAPHDRDRVQLTRRPAVHVEQVQFTPDVRSPAGTAHLVSDDDRDAGSYVVRFVARDAGSRIVGGGIVMVETVPARAGTALSFSLITSGHVTWLDGYAMPVSVAPYR